MTIEKFKIELTDAVLDDLRRRLDATRWPDEVAGAAWDYGTSLDYMQDLAAYWRNGYDWRRREAELNRLPQFRASLDGLRVHFVHQRGQGPKPLPLVISHGWPGSFVEMRRILPLLTDPAAHGGD
ncbi:MAG: epoxide hydrolase N-terminal domain-containing protein, partial [Rhodospirillales bacterium]|nr:epoxide hydrolase N-terminal domain-containing protein [Rhodospirillales bacterium]